MSVLKRLFTDPSKLLVNAVFVGLLLFLIKEVTVAFVKYHDHKVGRSIMDVHERYVRFPSLSVCFDLDTEKELGFKSFRPWNETFISLDFVWHHDNGYGHTLE